MPVTNPKKIDRFLKKLLIALGIVLVLFFALHLWFVHNARSVLKDYITEQSKGKIKLELSQLDLNLWTKKLKIHNADLLSIDSINERVTYHVTFNELSLKVGSLWSLLVDNQLILDSIKLYDPVVQVMQWRKDSSSSSAKEELSIPQEVGKIYQSLLSALDEFGIRRVIIDNATISLANKMKSGSEPVKVSRIFFDLIRIPTWVNGKEIYNKGDQKVEVRTSNQDIALPGGRHRLSFKDFKLQLFRERIDLDSCTITAVATDSLKSNYKIFFQKLALTGVDLSAMSDYNLIKADSVYCQAPRFDFNLYRSDAVKKKAAAPDPDQIIKELTGNLNLAFVGVKDAGIHFNIFGKTNRSFSNSNKDNFEMYAFRINPDSSKPVSIGRFDMTLRDYRLYNEDSSSVVSFDSLHFLNSRIALNNFGMSSRPGKRKLLNEIDIKVPYFELSQLNWYQLIFDQNLVAESALLNNPTINFKKLTATRRKKAGRVNMFNVLENLDSLVALKNVTMINGQVNMQLGASTAFNLQNLDFNIHSNELLQSINKEGIRSAVEYLSFSKGILSLKNITARLDNAKVTGNNLIYADRVAVTTRKNNITAFINNVDIDNMLLDDNAEAIEVDGLKWKSANVRINSSGIAKKAKGNSDNSLELRNLAGNNTQFDFTNQKTTVSTFVKSLNAKSLFKQGSDPIKLDGFTVVGSDLAIQSNALKMQASAYDISGDGASGVTGVKLSQIKGRDSLNIQASQLNFVTDLNDIFGNKMHLGNVQARDLFVRMNKWNEASTSNDTVNAQTQLRNSKAQSPMMIDKITAYEPDIRISNHRNDSSTVINIPKSEKSLLQVGNVLLDNGTIQLGSLILKTTAATFAKRNGEVIGVEKGKIDVDFSNLLIGKKDGKINWGAAINNLSIENANGLSLGKTKNNLRFQNVSIGNLNLSSEYLPNFGEMMKRNLTAWLRIPQGEYIDSNTTLRWYNADYSNNSGSLKLDSFIYYPTRSLDSAIAQTPYQFDYITMRTGAVHISGLDVARYERDSSFYADKIKISDPILTVFRDKKAPFNPVKTAKLLPVNMIRKIGLPVSVNTFEMENGLITYGERNAKTREEGTMVLTSVFGKLENIRNSKIENSDSLNLTFGARLMDSALLNLTLHQSYMDTLSGFLVNGKIRGAALDIFNPVLIPLSNVKLKSGSLDSMSFTAVGRQDLAYGEMRMHYKDLKIQLIKNGDPDVSTFLQKVISGLANTFIVKRSNTKRVGMIYTPRAMEQSFVNFLVKLTMSGVTTSVGAKKNKKFEKQYRKQLKASNNPKIKI